MANIKTFKDLIVWQKAHELVILTYKITADFPKHELFALVSQMRRAAVSIAANIVEGFRRKTIKDSLNFYNMSDASLEELKYHILLSFDLHYINHETYIQLQNKCSEVGGSLTNWIQSQTKYLPPKH